MTMVSCRTMADLVKVGPSHGIDLEELVRGLPVTVSTIANPRSRIPWEVFVELVRRCVAQAGGVDEMNEISRRMAVHPGKIQAILRFAITPERHYRLTFRWLLPSVLPVVRTEFHVLGPLRFRAVIEIPEPHQPSREFLFASVGSFEESLRLTGRPPATITASGTERRAEYLIEVPAEPPLRSRVGRLVDVLRDAGAAAEEILAQEQELAARRRELAEVAHALERRERALAEQIAARERLEESERALEAQLRQAQKMEAIGRFAGGIAHDFNNLLTIMMAASGTLERTPGLAEPVREAAEGLQYAIDRAAALTSQLLSFSRIRPAMHASVGIDGVVRAMQRLLGALVGGAVAFELDLRAGDAAVQADPNNLEQIIINLVANSRDAMPGGGTIAIATTATATQVSLVVTDTGSGMPPEVQARMFEPFFTTKDVHRGTGLGMAVVHDLVQQMAGTLAVESAPGRGTSIAMHLPRVAAEPALVPRREHGLVSTGSSELILLVEDDAAVLRMMVQALTGAGYRVVTAQTTAEALAAADRGGAPIDLLITDVMLGADRGTDIARTLRERDADLAVVFTSGFTGDLDIGSSVQGAAFLPKPFYMGELQTLAHSMLRRRVGRKRGG